VALLEFLEADPVTGHLLIVGSLGAGARALERRGIVLGRIVAVVDEGRMESKAGREPSPLAAEGVVGGVLSILHARLGQDSPEGLLHLTGPLMGMIALPYLGAAAARRELERPVPERRAQGPRPGGDSTQRGLGACARTPSGR
jgi:hypothetical protein